MSSDSESATEQPTIFIDPDGDLRLLIGASKQEVVVCSRTLARVSPAFRAMFYGPWTESKPSNKKMWIVELPEDNPEALICIFNIAHGRFDTLYDEATGNGFPNSLPFETVYQITFMTDKYDMTTIIRPWATTWAQMVARANSGHQTVRTLEHILWISWELGLYDSFRKAAEHIARHATASNQPGSSGLYIRGEQITSFTGSAAAATEQLEATGILGLSIYSSRPEHFILICD
jgi:hypothetical protein